MNETLIPYPSDAWIKELQRICNEDPEFKEACGTFSGKFAFRIEGEPGRLGSTSYLFLWADQGQAKEAAALSSLDDRPDAEYVITGKYSVWKNVVQAKLEPLRAIMTRKLTLQKGSQLKLLKQVRLALNIMKNCARIHASFPDDSP
jgi:putative sterol carrier protein